MKRKILKAIFAICLLISLILAVGVGSSVENLTTKDYTIYGSISVAFGVIGFIGLNRMEVI